MIGRQDWATEALKLAPPAAVGGLKIWGFSISEWVSILTAIYVLILISDNLFVKLMKWRARRNDSKKVEQELS